MTAPLRLPTGPDRLVEVEARWIALAVLAAVSATEFLIMLVLGGSLSGEVARGAALDTLLLAGFSAPVIYLGVYRTLRWLHGDRAEARDATLRVELIAQSTLEAIDDAVVVLNGEEALLYSNRAAVRLGAPPRGLPRPALPTPWPLLPPPALEALRATLRDGQHREVELALPREGGSRSFSLALSALGEAGHPAGVVCVWRDVTVQLEVDAALRKTSRAVEDSANIVVITNLDGTIDYVNRRFETVTGWTRQEVIGQRPSLLKSPGTPPARHAELWQTITSGGVWRGELLNQRRDGEPFWAAVSISGIRDAAGQLTHYFAIEEDVTTRKRAEEALERKVRELDGFAYAVAHDLKAPLLGVQRLARWIEEDLDGRLDPQHRDSFERLRARCTRLVDLVDAILRYARLGRAQQPTERVDVAELVRELLEVVEPPPGFVIELEPPLPSLETHKLLLFEVLLNLIRNAIQHHGGERGRITIHATRHDRWYRFCVKDDGPGIAPRHHQAIFEVFRTLAPAGMGSTGIGLTLVKKIVEELGGTVEVESAEGQGAAFFFTWPA